MKLAGCEIARILAFNPSDKSLALCRDAIADVVMDIINMGVGEVSDGNKAAAVLLREALKNIDTALPLIDKPKQKEGENRFNAFHEFLFEAKIV